MSNRHSCPIFLAVALAAGGLLRTSPALAQEKPVPQPPKYSPLTFNEDYSYLKDSSLKADPFDGIKYMPLTDDGSVFLTLGGQARYRYEYYNNFGFGGTVPQDDDGYHLLRVMGSADLHVTPYFRVFMQLIAATNEGRDPGPRAGIDEDDLDFHQAFAEFMLPVGDGKISVRGGRQNLLYGKQRLISPLDWTNTRRTFDGGLISYSAGGSIKIDGFWVHPVTVTDDELNSYTPTVDFAGVYAAIDLGVVTESLRGTTLDAYVLYLDRETATFAQGSGDEQRYTIGARLGGKVGGFDYDLEGAYQFGEFGDDDINAYFFAAEVGYAFGDVAFKPRPFIGFDYSSGDDDPADGELGTFNQLFPLAHAYHGYADILGRQNVIDLHPGVELSLLANRKYCKSLGARLAYHLFWRASDDDGIYTVAGGVSRGIGSGAGSDIGQEIDFTLNWVINRHASALFGYSHVFAGDYISDTGADGDISFFYTQLQFTF